MAAFEIHLTHHAVQRFRERVRPALSLAAAERELARLVAQGQIVTTPPAWHAERQRQTATAYLIVCDLVLPLESTSNPEALVAVTCIARGGISDTARLRRNELRRRERARRRARVPTHGATSRR